MFNQQYLNQFEKSLEQYRQAKRQAEEDLKKIPIQSAAFRKQLAAVHRAAGDFQFALADASLAIQRLTGSVSISLASAHAKRLKLPRKEKKAFIKRYGRKRYHSRYHRPGIMVMIDSPGGMM